MLPVPRIRHDLHLSVVGRDHGHLLRAQLREKDFRKLSQELNVEITKKDAEIFYYLDGESRLCFVELGTAAEFFRSRLLSFDV